MDKLEITGGGKGVEAVEIETWDGSLSISCIGGLLPERFYLFVVVSCWCSSVWVEDDGIPSPDAR